jgi:hypothetical protein
VATNSLSMSPPSANLGGVAVGEWSSGPTFTLSNTSGAPPQSGFSFTFEGPDANEFQYGQNCIQSLGSNESCQVSVQVRPSSAGPKTATLRATAVSGASATATLQANGLGPAVLNIAPDLHFGSVAVGSPSQSQPVTVTNVGGVMSGAVSISVMGTDQSSFSIAGNNCGAPLPAGGTCTASIVFNPTSGGSKVASVYVEGYPGGNASASLDGTGMGTLAVTFMPPSYDFGNVYTWQGSPWQYFSITNNGSGTLSFSLAIEGSDSSDFHLSNVSCYGPLNPGASCSTSVQFAPVFTSGPRNALLTVTDGSNNKASAPLTGYAQ